MRFASQTHLDRRRIEKGHNNAHKTKIANHQDGFCPVLFAPKTNFPIFPEPNIASRIPMPNGAAGFSKSVASLAQIRFSNA